jgi:hypothetical protein
MTSEEAMDSGLFGRGTPHKRLKDFLGDYVALATGKRMLWFRDEQGQSSGHKAAHAGLLPEEMTVPLILIER